MALVLRGARLGHQSLWVDEVFSWRSARIGAAFTRHDLLENIHGPLYGLLLHAWGAIAGDGELALRLPSAVFGAALVPALAWVARQWLGRDTMIPAAWLAAGSPFLLWYSQEARNYALLMLCATLASGAMLTLREKSSWRGLAGYAAASVAGLLSNFSFVLLAPVHAAWWLGARGERGKRLAVLAGLLVVMAAALAPWASQMARTWDWSRLNPGRGAVAGEAPLRGSTTMHAAAIPFTLHAFAVGYTLGPSLREMRRAPGFAPLRAHAVELVAVAAVFGATLVLGVRGLARRGGLRDAVLWMAIPMLVIGYFALMNFKVFHPRYLAVTAPAFLLTLAAGLAELRSRPRAALALAIAVLWGASLWNHYTVPGYGKEDARGAAALIRARGVAGDVVIAANAVDVLDYYYRGPLPVRPLRLDLVETPARLDGRLDELVADASGAWVVLTRPEDLDPRGVFAPYLEARYPQAERFDFEGVQVWHVARPGSPGAP